MYASETIFVKVKMYSDKTVEEQQNMTMDEWNSSLSHWATGDDGFPELQIPLHHIPSSNVTHPCGKVLTAAATQNGGGCWTEEPETVMTTAEVTILATILVTVFTCSVVANALVCVVFSKRRSSLSLSNCFLANLTLCNVLFTLLVMPFAFVSLVSRTWLFGAVLCQCTGLAINLLVSASIFTLAVISLDRYCAVVTPLHYTMRMTRRRCWAFIGGIWVASAVVSFPPVVGWNGFKFHVNKMICTVDWASPDPVDRYYTLFLVSLSFVLPLVAMLWTYSCIFRAARDNSERTRRSSIVPSAGGGGGGGGGSLCGGGGCGDGDLSQSTPINKRRRSSSVPIIRRLSQTSHRSSSLLQRREEWKTAVTSFLILFSFMLCWLPYFIVICIRSLAPELQLHPVMSTISSVAAMFGCACNPLVYVFRSKATRQDLKVILTRRRTFRNETVHGSAVRRGGSMRSERGEGGGSGGGGVGGGQGRGGVVEREKGSVFWHEDMFSQFGECHSIQEESSEPAGTDNVSSGTTTHSGSITATPSSLRASPSLQRC